MGRRLLCLALIVLLCTGCAFTPGGETTGDAALDGQVLELLQQICARGNSAQQNVEAVFDWLCAEIDYRAGTIDTSGGLTDALVVTLASDLLNRRRGDCDGEAALTAVLLRRLGCPCVIVQGQFLRTDGSEWVDHAWVIAQVEGKYFHIDPLYGRYYTDDARSCCMAGDAFMLQTHRWDQAACPACD